MEEGSNKETSTNQELRNYTILGEDNKFNKKKAVKRVLPQWLLSPTVISSSLQNLDTKVSSIKDLDKDLRKKLKQMNFKYFFPVQAAVIPWLLKSIQLSNLITPQDICVSAPTGSGKTLSFALPVIQALKKYRIRRIRALVILPTQDLATQVYKSFKSFMTDTNLNVYLITGNCAFETIENDKNEISRLNKCDVLVCTPGRLVDYLNEAAGFDLEQLQFLIIDEADRIMDNMQNNWLYHLERHMQKYGTALESSNVVNVFTARQKRVHKLLFSATLSVDPEKLQQLTLFQPKLFTCTKKDVDENEKGEAYVGKFTFPNELLQKYIKCKVDAKPLILYKFIKQENLSRVLVFTNSSESAKRLALLLQALFKGKLNIESVFGQLENSRRARLITDFSKGNTNVIVCTDTLARGIDLPNVECVVSYSVPKYLRTYIHRVGRTARAGETGMAVTLVAPGKANALNLLLKGQHLPEEIVIPLESLETLEKRYKKALTKLTDNVTRAKTETLRKMMTAKKPKKKIVKFLANVQ